VYTVLAPLCGSVARWNHNAFSILCSRYKNGHLYCSESFKISKTFKKRLDNFKIINIKIGKLLCIPKAAFRVKYAFSV
jgi:hypothetical protein